MKNRHKYFRNLRYKQKLETHYNNHRYSGIYFLTNEPDPRYEREYHFRWWRGWFEDKKYKGHNYYLYTKRPEVPYTIVEDVGPLYGNVKKFYKTHSNRLIRRCLKNEETYNHGSYKKQFDLWWTID